MGNQDFDPGHGQFYKRVLGSYLILYGDNFGTKAVMPNRPGH